jgi:protoporphyrinogen oxidase
MSYDVIIVGAGITGLRVGIETLTKSPTLRCCILEKYNYTGGRVVTYHKELPKVGALHWENGAGRISISHKKVLKLLKKYDLTFKHISQELNFNNTKNRFTELLPIFLQPLESLPREVLQMHTLKQLLHKVWGVHAREFYIQFPYYSEIQVVRADIALESFRSEMQSTVGFGQCKEGLSELIKNMVKEFESLGGSIIQNTEVIAVTPQMELLCQNTNVADSKKTFRTDMCIIALHRDAVQLIKGINTMPILKKLKMQPLLRMYAVFPVKKGVSWFTGIEKTVTDNPLRYVIPIDPAKGVIMISYTEGKDALYWMHHANPEQKVMKEIRKLFPTRSIPDPIFFKVHPWYNGTTYWLPGNYDVEDESRKALHPMPKEFPRLFMCGESFAVKQAWMEGALDHADQLCESLTYNAVLRSLSKK